MARFLVVHSPPAEMTQEEMIWAGRTLVNGLPDRVTWLRSWVIRGDGRVFCDWEAPTKAAAQDVLREVMEVLPVEVLYPVVAVDPAWFTQRGGS